MTRLSRCVAGYSGKLGIAALLNGIITKVCWKSADAVIGKNSPACNAMEPAMI
jgi:hypothetical protein